jgi:hypothetical protein
MLKLQGQVVNVLRHAEREFKGEKRASYAQVQLMVREPLQDGQERIGVQTLTTEAPDAFEALRGAEIAVPVGAYVRNGAVAYFMERDARPQPIPHSA